MSVISIDVIFSSLWYLCLHLYISIVCVDKSRCFVNGSRDFCISGDNEFILKLPKNLRPWTQTFGTTFVVKLPLISKRKIN